MISKKLMLIAIAAFFVSLSQSSVFAGSATEQYAGTIQESIRSAGEKVDYSATMEPRQASDKSDVSLVQKTDKGQESMKRYKMPADGEGERKIR